MTSNLTWEPVKRKKNDLSTTTKFVLRRVWGEPLDVTLSGEDCIQILRGVQATAMELKLDHALVTEMQDLIDALEDGPIHLKEEY